MKVVVHHIKSSYDVSAPPPPPFGVEVDVALSMVEPVSLRVTQRDIHIEQRHIHMYIKVRIRSIHIAHSHRRICM